jgi:hypothetical protein
VIDRLVTAPCTACATETRKWIKTGASIGNNEPRLRGCSNDFPELNKWHRLPSLRPIAPFIVEPPPHT